jgi:hypothetical protein
MRDLDSDVANGERLLPWLAFPSLACLNMPQLAEGRASASAHSLCISHGSLAHPPRALTGTNDMHNYQKNCTKNDISRSI